jgi:hypothetical protein
MTRWSGSIGLVVGAAALVASFAPPCSGQVYVPPGGWSPSRMPSLQPTAPAVIVGQIVDAATGRGVAKAIVRLEGGSAHAVRVADDFGRFYFIGLRGGQYSIAATKPGFIGGTYGQRRAGGDGLPVELAEHQWLTDTRISLWRSATLGGRVVDETGEPIVGVRVEARRREFIGGALQLTPAGDDVTDDHGAYRISDLLPGSYIVSMPSATVSGSADILDPTTETLAAQNPAASPEEAQATIRDSFVRIGNLRRDKSGAAILSSYGSILPEPPGASPARPLVYPTTYHPDAPTSSAADVVTLGNAEERGNVDVRVLPVPAAAIAGTVVGPDGPIGGQVLRLLAAEEDDTESGHERAVTTSGTDGTFVFPEVPAGHYVIDAPNHASLSLAGSVQLQTSASETASVRLSFSIVPSAPDAPGDEKPALWGRAPVVVDRDVADVKVEMSLGATVMGQVVFEVTSRRPPADLHTTTSVDAIFARTGRSARRAVVDDSGAFALRGLEPGEYFVHPSEPPVGWYVKSVTSQGRDLLAAPLSLTAAEHVMDVVVTFSDVPTEILGTVSDGRYYPIATATVLAFPAERQALASVARDSLRIRSARATTAGMFHLVGLPVGDYYLVAIEDATSDGWQDPQRLDALRATATRVSLRNTDPMHVDLRLVTKR